MIEDEKPTIERAGSRLQTRYGTPADRQDPKFTELFAKDATTTLPEYPPFAGLDAIKKGQADWKASGVAMRHIVTSRRRASRCPRRVYPSANSAIASSRWTASG